MMMIKMKMTKRVISTIMTTDDEAYDKYDYDGGDAHDEDDADDDGVGGEHSMLMMVATRG